jgi:outer membrane immunogenic protein
MRVSKTLAAAGLAAGLMTAASTAALADAPTFNWQGFYIGAVATGTMATFDNRDYWCELACDAPNQTDFHGSIGVTVGHNWQNGNFVYGIEADLSTGFDDNLRVTYDLSPDTGVVWTNEWDYFATIRGRAGVAIGDTLLAATGGVVIRDANYRSNEFESDGDFGCDEEDPDDNNYCAHYSDTDMGLALGVVVEHAISSNVTIKFDYLWVGLPTVRDQYDEYEDEDGSEGYYSVTTNAHMARIGVNWALN